MESVNVRQMKIKTITLICTLMTYGMPMDATPMNSSDLLTQVQLNRDNAETLQSLLPILGSGVRPGKYEQNLLTLIRDKNSTVAQFRELTGKLGEHLVIKAMECLPTSPLQVNTPVAPFTGSQLVGSVNLVSIMRSGDALIETFTKHFPDASVSKILIQRDEVTAEPQFIYMKLSPTLGADSYVVITEPMIATGGTLSMVINLLKEKGVQEENIVVACVCAAPEGLVQLNMQFPKIKVVMNALDDHLNEKKYIVPGLGDFGDRFFGS